MVPGGEAKVTREGNLREVDIFVKGDKCFVDLNMKK